MGGQDFFTRNGIDDDDLEHVSALANVGGRAEALAQARQRTFQHGVHILPVGAAEHLQERPQIIGHGRSGFGAAFTVIFTVIAASVIVVIMRLARKLYSFPWAVALGLLLGGALGNLTDRIFRSPGVFNGQVVDFIAPKGFAIFNLADSAIVCGGILIVLLSFRGLDPNGTVHKD